MKVNYVQDPDGKEMLVRDGAPIAMAWEKPYFEACIDALRPSGDVLEVGYGCGFAAAHIQAQRPRSHTIIENFPEVADRARDDFTGIKVIEGPWEKILPSLGGFDAIFFHDYFCKLVGKPGGMKTANLLVKAGKALVDNVLKKFSLHSIRYSDDDVASFLKMMEKKNADDKKMVLRFFSDLYKQGQITLHQWESVCEEIEKRGWMNPEEIAKAKRTIVTAVAQHDSRLLEFFILCLEKHMKKGARFSCYLEDPTSKYEDPVFLEKVIHNHALDYSEHWVDVHVSEHCPYYREDRALVITITKV